MAQTLLNKVAVITGAGSGIGRATAELFLNEGAKVVLFGRTAAPLDDIAAIAPARALAVSGDVTKTDDLNQLATAITRRFGQMDVLVASAGIVRVAPLIEADPQQIDEQVEVNFKGTLNTVRALVPALNPHASVICLSGRLPNELGFGAFNASKSAVTALTRTFAAELAPREIRVNAIAPGPTDTPFWQNTGLTKQQTNKLLTALKKCCKSGQLGSPQDVAEVALFLASEAARKINGQEIIVDAANQ